MVAGALAINRATVAYKSGPNRAASRDDGAVPLLTFPTISSGRLAATDQPELRADGGLRLRPWVDSDAPRVRVAYDDPATQRWHARVLNSDDEARELIAGWRQGWTTEAEASWAVVDAADRLVGRVALKSIDLHEGIADVAYWTVPDARGREVSPRAVRAAAHWAIGTGFHRLQLEHSVANHASCRVAVKAGFRLEGTRRSAALHADGWHDMHTHVVLAPDGLCPGEPAARS